VCDLILPVVSKMTIDSKEEVAMTRYKGRIVKTDHRMLKLEVNLTFHKEKHHDRIEVFNVRNKKCLKMFCEFTSKDDVLSKCFESQEEDFNVQFSKWKRKFFKSINACFRKVRIKQNTFSKLSRIDELMSKKKTILRKKKLSHEDETEIDRIDSEITEEISEKEYKKLQTVCGDLQENSNTNIWTEMRKVFPKNSKPLPTGVMNIKGKVITNPNEKKTVSLEHFKHRMRKRSVKEEVKEIEVLNNKLFAKRLSNAKENISPPFEMKELDFVLKTLKSGKSKDPENYVSELFKEGAIGSDLKKSILMMINRMKHEMIIPECLRTAHITILHKRSSKLDLNNWRGIFVCSILRKMLKKMVHERTYEKVARNMSDSQIGAKRNKSVRNHLFVLNSIISDVMSSVKKEPIDLNVMDFKQMFDAEELSVCLNALYDANIQDDMLALIYEANKTTIFAVKTPNGTTRSAKIVDKVLQGDVLAPFFQVKWLKNT
jgi:hypothetical protein